MKTFTRLLQHASNLLYPNLCLACGQNLSNEETCICISCHYHLPKTHFNLDEENYFTEQFWGRIPIEGASSLYYFSKGGRTQRLMHNLKYRGQRQVGIQLGELLGKKLSQTNLSQEIDLILPVPLHYRKEKIRGYNQSDMLAQGISKSMQIPWRKDILFRQENTSTQTQMSRIDRFQNVKEAFQIKRAEPIRNKHVLLVDDVMTTGATLEACGGKILEIEGVKLSLVTLVIAKN